MNFWISSVFEYLLMFVIIFYGQTVWMRLLSISYYTLNYVAAVLTIILIILQERIRKKYFIKAGILGLAVFFYLALSGHSVYYVTVRVILPLVLFVIYLSSVCERDHLFALLKKFSDIICVLSFLSVILYVLGTLLRILPYGYVSYDWAGLIRSAKHYFHLLYETQVEDFFGIEMVRNCGIFCEAPSYAVPLILSIFYEMFVSEKISKFRVTSLIAAIITSFSTKALLIVCIVMGLKLIEYAYVNEAENKCRQIVRLLVPIVIIMLSFAAIMVFEQKIDSNSFVSRMDNLNTTMAAFRDHWLIGVGVGNEDAISAYSSFSRSFRWKGFSIGATVLLAQGGLYLTLFYTCGFLNALKNAVNKWLVLSFGIVHFALLFTSNIPYFLSTIFILAMEYSIPKHKISC